MLKAFTAFDVLSDAMSELFILLGFTTLTKFLVISIPVLSLWPVQMQLRRKLLLGAILCPGIITIACSIVRVCAIGFAHGQVDSNCSLLWIQVEAAVAVIVISVSAIKKLFSPGKSHRRKCPKQTSVSRAWIWSRRKSIDDRLPFIPGPTLTGVQSFLHRSPDHDAELEGSDSELHLSNTTVLDSQP